MTSTNKDQARLQVYQFHLNGEKGAYELSFSLDNDNITSACSCQYNSESGFCWHRYYVLAGKTQRLNEADRPKQAALIRQLSVSTGGKELIGHAKAVFGEKETCRRCNSTEVLDLKKSFAGKFIKWFVPKGRRYFCWSCRWTW